MLQLARKPDRDNETDSSKPKGSHTNSHCQLAFGNLKNKQIDSFQGQRLI
jgi:hypothetical protein